MATDTAGQFWRGEDFNDLVEHLREFRAGRCPVARVNELVCSHCASETFRATWATTRVARARCLACDVET